MPFNGSGQFVLPAGQPVATGTVIDSTVFNALTSDLATALTNCITRDGQSPATGNIPLGANRITGLAAGVASTDGVNLTQVQALIQNGTLQLLTSVAGTNTITATASGPIAAYAAGQVFLLVAANSITGAATLNVASTATPGGIGAKAITKYGARPVVQGDILAGAVYELVYDGTQFQIITPQSVLIQRLEATPYTAQTSDLSVFPLDGTIPQIGEGGGPYLSRVITPTKTTSRLVIEVSMVLGSDSGNTTTMALFQDSTGNALAATLHGWQASGYLATVTLRHEMVAGTTSATTFTVRLGNNTGSVYVNRSAGQATLYGGILAGRMSVSEYSA